MNTASAEPSIVRDAQDTAFRSAAALVFGICVAATIRQSLSMPMPWMRMPGQTWPGAALAFLAMWVAMMGAMMLPSLMPVLCRYRRALSGSGASRNRLTALVSAGYFCIWSALGVAVFPLGVAVATLQARLPALARCAPLAAGVLIVVAGTLQFTSWKAHYLACCRGHPRHDRGVPADAGAAWRYGLQCGRHCCYCCAGLTAILLVLGIMDLRAMALVTLAITAERLTPSGEAVARGIGIVAVATGLILVARA
jgi:predicted metal-binding membrane protein